MRTRVRNWFARRFGSRFADRIDDFVHDLYVEQLLRPGGLATFVPPSATSDRYLAFRKFLSVVVKNFCLNKCQKVGRMLARESFDDPPERRHARTGDVEFVRYCALAVVKRSYERLRERYAKRGRPQYFAVLAPVLIGPEPDYAEIARQLGQKRDSVRRSKKSMWAHWRRELRSTVADTLNLPLSMDRELRRKLIDEEIRQLLQALFDEGDEDD